MPIVVNSELDLYSEVEKQLTHLIDKNGILIISIDGLGGTGKTTFASTLSTRIRGIHIELDKYLVPHRGRYLHNLQFEKIAYKLNIIRDSNCSFLIIEGLCVLSVLEELNLTPDISIYIKKVDENGNWREEGYYSENNDREEIFQTLSRIEAKFPNMPGIANNDRDLVSYHIEKKPISHSNIVWEKHNESSMK